MRSGVATSVRTPKRLVKGVKLLLTLVNENKSLPIPVS